MPVRGARQVAGNIRDLSRYVAVPLNTASRFALQPTLSAARKNAKAIHSEEKTGTLAASLVIKRESRSPKYKPKHQIGPSSDYERNTQYGKRKPVKYAHLLEFGTAPHYQPGRGVTHPGSHPEPFLTPAYNSTKETVVKRFGERIGPELEKRAAKLGAKAK